MGEQIFKPFFLPIQYYCLKIEMAIDNNRLGFGSTLNRKILLSTGNAQHTY